VLIVYLDTKITGTFSGADIHNLEKGGIREKLRQLLARDVWKIIITTIFKKGLAERPLQIQIARG
jgi:type I restriction enzyme R subunit